MRDKNISHRADVVKVMASPCILHLFGALVVHTAACVNGGGSMGLEAYVSRCFIETPVCGVKDHHYMKAVQFDLKPINEASTLLLSD